MANRIKPGSPKPHGKIPAVPEVKIASTLRFSFKLFQQNDKFSLGHCGDGYLPQFVVRLKGLSGLTVHEFRTNRSGALRAHQIDFSETSEPQGFHELNEQLRGLEAWQFQITANEHGRVHGILLDETFYVVWIDAAHQLYPAN